MQKALFLDRDGVINVEKNYLYKIEDFEFIDGIFEVCKYYEKLGYIIIVITNQSGIARDFYNEEDFLTLTKWMNERFSQEGTHISEVYFCPHLPAISGRCQCRKPNPGMILEAADKYNIDIKNSVLIGDKERDIEAGLNAGIEENYLFDLNGSVKSSKAKRIIHKFSEIWEDNANLK